MVLLFLLKIINIKKVILIRKNELHSMQAKINIQYTNQENEENSRYEL